MAIYFGQKVRFPTLTSPIYDMKVLLLASERSDEFRFFSPPVYWKEKETKDKKRTKYEMYICVCAPSSF